ncbi:MAG: outer membrane protein assembly factor BamE [Gammaproteobacteria bacterium]|nr:MAG: outer membrane protein assembly factor BamE [Gammaproteobacteria bacterium]
MPSFSMPRLPSIHKFDIQQGNVITQEMIDQLKPGMTKSQVRFIMGTPLVADTFNEDRWDYYYSLVPAEGEEVRERVAIIFEDEKLVGFHGDFIPSAIAPPPAAPQEDEAGDAETPNTGDETE